MEAPNMEPPTQKPPHTQPHLCSRCECGARDCSAADCHTSRSHCAPLAADGASSSAVRSPSRACWRTSALRWWGASANRLSSPWTDATKPTPRPKHASPGWSRRPAAAGSACGRRHQGRSLAAAAWRLFAARASPAGAHGACGAALPAAYGRCCIGALRFAPSMETVLSAAAADGYGAGRVFWSAWPGAPRPELRPCVGTSLPLWGAWARMLAVLLPKAVRAAGPPSLVCPERSKASKRYVSSTSTSLQAHTCAHAMQLFKSRSGASTRLFNPAVQGHNTHPIA
eukprot:365264-Chlamydomonas_euryale.AAC.4